MTSDITDRRKHDEPQARQAPTAPQWLYGAVLLVIAIAPSQLAWSPDPKSGPFISYGDASSALVILLWALWRVRNKMAGLTWPPMAIAGLLLVALLSAGMAESIKLTALAIIQITLYFVAAYMLFADVLTTRGRLVGALVALAIPTVVNLAVACQQYFTAETSLEVGGLLSNRNVYSAYLAMVLPIGFGIMLWLQRGPLVVLLGATTAVAVLTMLSPPMVWVALLVVACQCKFAPRRAGYRGLALLAVLTALVVFLPKNHDTAVRELLDPREEGEAHKLAADMGEVAEDTYIVKKRWLEWKPALNMMAENFMLGVGAGNFQLNIGRTEYYGFLPNVRKSEPDTNNLYLVIGSTMGFAGLVCLVAYLGHFWRKASTLWLSVERGWMTGLAVGLAGSVAALAMGNIFTSLFVRGTGLVWALLFAIIAVISQGKIRDE